MYNQRLNHMLKFMLFIILVSGFNSVFAETKDVETDHHAADTQKWSGIYYGFLPCADCIGIKTSLALNKNNTYIAITQFVGKSEREFTEKGKFEKGETNIILTPRDGSASRQYLIGNDTLTALDSNGKRITGKDAEKYMLRRTDVTSITQQHGH